MSFYLGTHVLLWLQSAPERIPGRVRSALESRTNVTVVSVVSIWEIAIKASPGRLGIVSDLGQWFPGEIARNDMRLLPIELSHAVAIETLAHLNRDPIDRLLLVQGMVEGLSIVTADRTFARYVARLTPIWVD